MNRIQLLDETNNIGKIDKEIDFDPELSEAYGYFDDLPVTEDDFEELRNIEQSKEEELEKINIQKTEKNNIFISNKIKKNNSIHEKIDFLKNYNENENGFSEFLKNGLQILSKRNKEASIAYNYPRAFLTIKENEDEKLNLNNLDPIINRVINIKSIKNKEFTFDGITPKKVSITTKNPIFTDTVSKSSFYLFPFKSDENLLHKKQQKNKELFVIENLVTKNPKLNTTSENFKFNVDVCALFLTEYFSRNIIHPNFIGHKILQKFYEDYHGIYNSFFHSQLSHDFHILLPSDKKQLDYIPFPIPIDLKQFVL